MVTLLLVQSVLACRPSTPPQPPPPSAEVEVAPTSLRVMSWNVKYLRDNQAKTKRTPADYAQLQKYVAMAQPDIVALQEIENTNAAHRVFDRRGWHVECAFARNVQRVCFAVRRDRGITWQRHPDVAAINTTGTLRDGLDITFAAGGVELRILNVHLKAGCKGTRDLFTSVGDACTKLRSQVEPLTQWVAARAREATPFLVVGDFNRELLHPQDQMWPQLAGHLRNVAVGHTPKCWGGEKPEYIDHILVDPRAAGYVVPGSFFELEYSPTQQLDTASDHCPITVDFLLPG